MKTNIVIAALVVSFATMGFDCINEGFQVAINLSPFNGCYFVNTGISNHYSGQTEIDSRTLYDQSYELTGVGLYDIRVQSVGTDLGAITNGIVYVNVGGVTQTLATYSGTWTDFATPRSILNSPTLVQANPVGVALLVQAVQNKATVTLSSEGDIGTIPPTSTESSVCVSAYVQAIGTP